MKTVKVVVRAALPSLMSRGTQDTLALLDVKGAATLASASDRDRPTWAAFSA